MKRVIALATALALGATMFMVAPVAADPDPKVWVCKYVGQPGVNERLQTGQNPIAVSINATKNAVLGEYFNDKQGRSYVLAFKVGDNTNQGKYTGILQCPQDGDNPPDDPPEDDPPEDDPPDDIVIIIDPPQDDPPPVTPDTPKTPTTPTAPKKVVNHDSRVSLRVCGDPRLIAMVDNRRSNVATTTSIVFRKAQSGAKKRFTAYTPAGDLNILAPRWVRGKSIIKVSTWAGSRTSRLTTAEKATIRLPKATPWGEDKCPGSLRGANALAKRR